MNTTAPPAAALDGKSFAIGILSVTACVLFVGLLLMGNEPAARASGQNDRAGDYLMLTHQIDQSVEGVLVIDAAAKMGIVYGYDYNRRSVQMLMPRVRLDKLPDGREARRK